jgi:hypothetical protein
MKDLSSFASYSSTISEATGYRRRSALEKYGIIGAKLLFSVLQDRSEENVMKEIGQAGLSVLCDIGGRVTGDMQRAAQAELFSNAVLDIATSSISNTTRRHW